MALIHLWEDVSTFKPEIIARAADLKESAVLIEKDGTPIRGLMKIRGVFQRYDIINANGRKYEKSLWERVLKDERVLESINSGSMHGLTEHPEDGKTRLDRGVTIIMTKIWDDNKGNIMGEAVIPATHAGKDVAAIIDAGGSIGVSSRADGEVEMVSEGYQRVKPETFTLITWDVVSDNSVPGARPTAVRESNVSKPAATITETATPRQDPVKITTMSKIGEMRKLDLVVSQLVRPGFKGLTFNHKVAVLESLGDFKSTCAQLMAEDKSVTAYGTKVLKMIEDAETAIDTGVPGDAPPPPPAAGGDASPADEGMTEQAFTDVLSRVLKDLCPECDDLKVKEVCTGLYAKFTENEPLGIMATVDLLRETADKGVAGADGAPAGDVLPPEAPPPEVQLESALAIIRSMSEGAAPSAKLTELEKSLKDAQAKLVESDKVKERLTKNLQLLKESADYIEASDKKLAETEAVLAAAVKLLKEHKIDDASILLMQEKKGKSDCDDNKDTKKAKEVAGDDAKAKEIEDAAKAKKDKKEESLEEGVVWGVEKDGKFTRCSSNNKVAAEALAKKVGGVAKVQKVEDKATTEAIVAAENTLIAEAEKLTETKVKEEFTKTNDGKKTIKEIEETMNAMFTDVDWKKMVNFESIKKEIEAKLTESKTPAPEAHDFVRQMARLREGAFRQLNSNSTKK